MRERPLAWRPNAPPAVRLGCLTWRRGQGLRGPSTATSAHGRARWVFPRRPARSRSAPTSAAACAVRISSGSSSESMLGRPGPARSARVLPPAFVDGVAPAPETLGAQSPSTSARAVSRSLSSLALRRPTDSPSRSGLTAVVCSTSTRVDERWRSIVGRNDRGGAAVDVGETSTVESASSSSAWTTTAYRPRRCSEPRLPRGTRRRKTSPRTTPCQRPPRLPRSRPSQRGRGVPLRGQRGRLPPPRLPGATRLSPPQLRRLVERQPDRLGVTVAFIAQDSKILLGMLVQPSLHGPRHLATVLQIVLRR